MRLSLEEICRIIGAEIPPATPVRVHGNGCDEHHETLSFSGIASIEDAGPDDICFLSNPRYAKYLETTRAGAVIVARNTIIPEKIRALAVDDPYFAFMQLLDHFNARQPSDIASGIDPHACIHPDAALGNGVSVGPYAVIGQDVRIGDGSVIGSCTVILTGSSVGENCLLYPNVTIMDRCTVGNRVIIHAGAVIGSDGFGFVPHDGVIHKIPQIGSVVIEDDVEIGACTCIDRAAFGVTVIERGSKLDNLIQVAHNVRIGSNTVIASQTGISGSTRIGNWVKLGGQAGLAGHLNVGDGASVGAQAGVTKDVPPRETVSGYPAKNHMKAMRLEAALRHLPELMQKVKDQEKRIQELERIIKDERLRKL